MRAIIPVFLLALVLVALFPAPLHGAAILDVQSIQKIGRSQGGFTGTLDEGDRFGNRLAPLGDLDGDGVVDLAASAYTDNDGGPDRGAIWILFLNPDGTVHHQQKISQLQGGFTGDLVNGARLGAPAGIGDLDGDGVPDLAAGASTDKVDGVLLGAVYIFNLNPDGTVKAQRRISEGLNGFSGNLDEGALFGCEVASLGDLDGDGVTDLAVGSYRDNDGGEWHGAVWILFLNSDGTVKAHRKISDTLGGFSGDLDSHDFFGISLAPLGDLDGDGVPDLAASADADDDGGPERGAVWILLLNSDGTVKAHQKISSTSGGLSAALMDEAWWGSSITAMGDIDGNGATDLLVQGYDDERVKAGPGAVWLVLLNPDGTVKAHQKFSVTDGSFPEPIRPGDRFGSGGAALGDLDGDGGPDFAVSADQGDPGGSRLGSVYVVFTQPMGPDRISAGHAVGLPDVNTVPLPVSLSNQASARGLEFVLTDEPGVLTVLDVVPRDRASGMTASFVDHGGNAKILLYDIAGYEIRPGSGPVLDVFVKIGGSAEIGDVVDVLVSDALVSYADGGTGSVETGNGTVTLGRIPGDLNGDNRVDVGDIVRLVEIILGVGNPPGHQEQELADCNGDEAINIGDISCFVDLMLDPVAEIPPMGFLERTELRVHAAVPVKGFQFFVERGRAWLTSEAGDFELTYGHGHGSGRGLTFMAYDRMGEGRSGESWSPVILEGSDPAFSDFRAYGVNGEPLQVEVSGQDVYVGASFPARLRMLPSLPNPFRARTQIRFASDRAGKAQVTVFDIRGRRVSVMPERSVAPGEVVWDWRAVDDSGRDLPAGIYLARVRLGGTISSVRLTHLGQ